MSAIERGSKGVSLSHNFRCDVTFTVSKSSPLNGALVTVAKLQISEPYVIEMPKRGRSLS